ncbi:hypothetical protein RKI04_24940 [Citrobacter amalonaticus]|uniref:hypothetical protein n=1 Tax=Citrobacter amalonaticus TaxID=35703 RepID=UPI00287AB7F0|nr:hypothetical protein [Citrobacter amalonaticus]MDS4039466.1 hypothetical protein [Citrobacter amalonaticus]
MLKDKNKENKISCISRMVYVQGAITQHVTLNFIFDNDNTSGVVHIEGVQFLGGVNKGIINRNIHFSYVKNDDNFILTSRYIRVLKGESLGNDEIKRSFPAFYSTENSKIDYTISWQKNSGFIFLIAGTPRFFCEKM